MSALTVCYLKTKRFHKGVSLVAIKIDTQHGAVICALYISSMMEKALQAERT
jgi:hypothetical protein